MRKRPRVTALASEEPPIIFVHLGPTLPRHFLANLVRADRQYAGNVVGLIEDSNAIADHTGTFKLVDIRNFYDPSRFRAVLENSALDSRFREGFWHKAIERFFVLAQFTEGRGISRYFHCESDVLIFSIDGLATALDRFGQQLFIPRDSKSRAIASLIYVNSPAALASLLAYIESSPVRTNEMEILASFMDEVTEDAIALPTLDTLDGVAETAIGWKSLTTNDTGGLFDAAGIGQWVAGTDPRNSKKTTFNHFRNEMNAIDFSELNARFDRAQNYFSLNMKHHAPKKVFNLHVHSKALLLFKSDRVISLLAKASNLRFSLPMNPGMLIQKFLLGSYFGQSRLKRRLDIFARNIRAKGVFSTNKSSFDSN